MVVTRLGARSGNWFRRRCTRAKLGRGAGSHWTFGHVTTFRHLGLASVAWSFTGSKANIGFGDIIATASVSPMFAYHAIILSY